MAAEGQLGRSTVEAFMELIIVLVSVEINAVLLDEGEIGSPRTI